MEKIAIPKPQTKNYVLDIFYVFCVDKCIESG